MAIILSEKIAFIEEQLNYVERLSSRKPEAGTAVSLLFSTLPSAGINGMFPTAIRDINNKLRSISFDDRYDYLAKMLKNRGYVKKDGYPDFNRFSDDAHIVQSVLNRFINRKSPRTDHDTLLKLVLALRMNIEDAKAFLEVSGSGFALASDLVDRIVFCYISLDYFNDQTVDEIVGSISEILAYYSQQELSLGNKPLRVLYKDLI